LAERGEDERDGEPGEGGLVCRAGLVASRTVADSAQVARKLIAQTPMPPMAVSLARVVRARTV
jgi:hypothetical protein